MPTAIRHSPFAIRHSPFPTRQLPIAVRLTAFGIRYSVFGMLAAHPGNDMTRSTISVESHDLLPESAQARPRTRAIRRRVSLLVLCGLAACGWLPAHAAGAPVPVVPTDVAGPSQPVAVQAILTTQGGFASGTVYTVPAGKRLVIESVSVTTETVSNTPNAYSVLVVVNNFAAFTAVPAVAAGGLASGSTATRLYADPGTLVLARIFGKTTTNDSVGVSISGYLVDATAVVAAVRTPPVAALPAGLATSP